MGKNNFNTHALIFLLITLLPVSMAAQTLFTLGEVKVDVPTFKKAFQKNYSGEQSVQPADIDQYLDIYIRFRMKLQAAKDLRLDTILRQQEEVRNFRNQLETPFLTDQKLLDQLVSEAAERGKKEIRISHIFIPFNNEKDSANAFKLISEAHDLLKQNVPFAIVAQKYSQDPDAQQNGGDLGFLTVFQLPYPLENIAYNLPPSTFAEPIRTKLGWHILLKTAERAARGKVQIRQILLVTDPEATREAMQLTALTADSVYQALLQGASFDLLEKKYGYANTGFPTEPIWIATGDYAPEFTDVVFSLKDSGHIAKPIRTAAGYHIIMKTGQRRVEDYNNTIELSWSFQLQNDPRSQLPRKSFAQQCIDRTQLKQIFLNDDALWSFTDAILDNQPAPAPDIINNQTVLLTFPDQQVNASEWIDFLMTIRSERSAADYQNHFRDFQESLALKRYRERLESFDPDFAELHNEFMEGNMIFEAMERKVWKPAASDTAGLYQWYRKNLSNYPQQSFEEAKAQVTLDYQAEVEKKWLQEISLTYPVKVNRKVLAKMKASWK